MKEISYENLKGEYEKVLSDFYGKEITISNDEFNDDLSNASWTGNFHNLKTDIRGDAYYIEVSDHKGKIVYFDYKEVYNPETYEIKYYID